MINQYLYQYLVQQDLKEKEKLIKKIIYFISDKQFNELIKKNKFIEYANVFGFRYGTLKKTVNNFFKKKKDVLFDIDWQGLSTIKTK